MIHLTIDADNCTSTDYLTSCYPDSYDRLEDLMYQATSIEDAMNLIYLQDRHLLFIRFGMVKIGLRFKHYIYYLKHRIKTTKWNWPQFVTRRIMHCDTAIYIKRKRNVA